LKETTKPSPPDSTTLHAAVRLFNEGQYLAAHELFEELWEAGEGGDDDFYKGLIQAAIAMHHLEDGNPKGAGKLYGGHRRYLGGFLPAHGGLNVERFLASMQEFFAPILRGEPRPDAQNPATRPRIERMHA
jgi:predicted metal-dependent hydrolase